MPTKQSVKFKKGDTVEITSKSNDRRTIGNIEMPANSEAEINMGGKRVLGEMIVPKGSTVIVKKKKKQTKEEA